MTSTYIYFLLFFHLGRKKSSEVQKNDLLDYNKVAEIIAGIGQLTSESTVEVLK